MAFTSGFTAVTGATFTAAQYNTNVRDNFSAIWVYTTAGDIAYATGSTTASRLAIGGNGALLYSTGSAPAWKAIGSGYDILRVSGGVPIWDGIHFASVYHNTTQTVGTGSATALAFNAENSDLRGWHTTGGSNSRITVSATGYYQASAYLLYAGTGSDDSHYRDNIEFRINGTAFAIDRRIQIKDAFDKIFSVTAPIVPMTASDYIEIYLEQNSGGTRTVAANPIFSLWRIA